MRYGDPARAAVGISDWSCLVVLALGVGLLAHAAPVQADGRGTESARAAAGSDASLSEQADERAARGFEYLTTRPYLPPDFDQQVFDSLWKVWPEPLRSQAESCSPAERRHLAFSRYGMLEPPVNEGGDGPALGYVDDGRGGWVMNCLTCHAGQVAGRVILGAPNTHLALATLTEDVRAVKLMLGKQFSHLDLGSLRMPLGTTNGTTNSVIFGVALGALRDRHLNLNYLQPAPKMIHHDMDAPPLWNVARKKTIYADGFAPKSHRVLMQFIFVPSNGPDEIKGWEDDFRDILAWIESLQPPEYPWAVDHALAGQGESVFRRHCSRCHGTYGPDGRYSQRVVPLDEVGTDPVRLHALAPEYRKWMRDGWLGRYGEDEVVIKPQGYVAPPLDGVWASAPYFHNGSVPTLWHVLHADVRPAVWRRTEDGYDTERVGLEAITSDTLPSESLSAAERRQYFDTRLPGKSAAGHRFPEVLSGDEKRAVLEYLKTL